MAHNVSSIADAEPVLGPSLGPPSSELQVPPTHFLTRRGEVSRRARRQRRRSGNAMLSDVRSASGHARTPNLRGPGGLAHVTLSAPAMMPKRQIPAPSRQPDLSLPGPVNV